MTKAEKRKALWLCIAVAVLTLVFVILTCISTGRNSDKRAAATSSLLASEAQEQTSIPPITGEASSSEASSAAASEQISSREEADESAESVQHSTASEHTASQPNLSDDSGEWYLRLVNANHILPDDFSPELATISMDYARDEGMQFDARAINQLEAMCAAAEADGVDLLVISAYRTFSVQEGLYNNKVNYYLDQGYGTEEAKALAATVVARPKTSEHNLGLAVDFNDVEERFAQTEAYTWLRAHCAEYGFIMRYDKSKQDITGVIYEPWHYRYVGVDVAHYITEKNITLEEFLGQQ